MTSSSLTKPQSQKWLNYHHLYYFRAIATEGSIAKAAAKLRLGQPTLSAQLKQFESQLELQLFERHHKRLTLTEAGRVALEYANEIFRMGDEMMEALHDRLAPNRIHVQLGALDSVPKHIALALAREAYRMGNCTVSLLEGKGDELLRELSNHRIDLFVSNFAPSPNEVPGITSRSIAKLPVAVCGSPRFRLLKRGFPGSLHQKPFIMPTAHSKLRHDLEHFFKLHSLTVDVVAETQDTSIQKLMGVDGLGLVPLSLPAAEEAVKKGELHQLGVLPGVFEEVFLISAARKIENPISSKLMRAFKL